MAALKHHRSPNVVKRVDEDCGHYIKDQIGKVDVFLDHIYRVRPLIFSTADTLSSVYLLEMLFNNR